MRSYTTYSEAPIGSQILVERPRLLERLQLATKHRLILLTAPPGYGKTTLVAQFASQTSHLVAWHTVEERERDVPNLYAHAIAALSDFVPALKDSTPPKGATPYELASIVTDALRTRTFATLVYILDDAHHLIGSPGAEAWLRSFVTNFPSSCQLILTSRVLPNLPLADMVARQEVLAFGQEQLCFTTEETHRLANKLGAGLDANELEQITSRLAGWPAGVILALQPLPREIERVLFKGGEGPEALFDTLAELMLNAQPPNLRDFLLASSTLTRMTPDLCKTVLQLPNSSDYFSEALSRNIFLSALPGGLTYHPLFRDFLQRQLITRHPTRFMELHTKAARWFEENNLLEDAFEHYFSADQPGRAAAIAERAAQAYLSQGKIDTLLYWRSRLSQLQSPVPKLVYACAMVHTDRYEYDLAVADLNDAEEGFQVYQDRVGLIEVELLRANIDNQRGNFLKAASQAEQIASFPTTPSNLRGYALYILGKATLNLGEPEKALTHLEKALPLFRATEDAYSVSPLLQQLEVVYLLLGRFDEAAACLQEVVAIHRSLGTATGLAAALNNLGYQYHMLGDYDQAKLTYEEGLSVASRSPEKRVESYLLWSQGDLLRDRGSFAEASQLYRKALEIIGDGEPALRCSVVTSLSTLERWQGSLDNAIALATEAVLIADTHGASLEKIKAEVAIWAALTKKDDVPIAREMLEKLRNVFSERQLLPQLAQTWGLCAHNALLSSDTVSARKYLNLISTTITHHANLQPLVAEIMHTPLLRKYVTRHAPRYPLIAEALKRLEDAQVSPAVKQKASTDINTPATYSLRVWCLGHEYVERDGNPVLSSDWQATTARELFFYLLFKGASNRELISLAFWPDDAPRQVRANFHTTLYRARHAVGANTIVFQDDLYFINPEINVWCDVYELQQLVRQARLLPPRTAHAENLWRRAVELYRGDFLSPIYSEWVVSFRADLQETYLDALFGMANTARAREEYHEAVATLKRALQIDPFREDIHRSILICFALQGERQLLIKHLEDFTNLLRRELGAAPSEETLALATSLRDGTYFNSPH